MNFNIIKDLLCTSPFFPTNFFEESIAFICGDSVLMLFSSAAIILLPPVTIEDMNESLEFQDRNYLNKELKEMFFNLDLIQSYGSGIRRAKNAMADNGSPKLIFEPDNDTDDYTMVTAYINEEYARVSQEEEGKLNQESLDSVGVMGSNGTTQTTQLILSETERKILKVIKENRKISQSKIAETVGIDVNNVKYYTRSLTKKNVLSRIGNNRSGEWIINERLDVF